MKNKVYIAILRRPTNKKKEARSDPFWEFGSFGLTGCHERNLLNPKKANRLKRSRIAFVQGGNEGFKLLLITPPVNCQLVNGKFEIIWEHDNLLPFKYKNAPVIVKNESMSDFPYIMDMLINGKRSTDEGKFASAFRSRTKPLETEIAKKLTTDFDNFLREAKPEAIISKYTEALPWDPPKPDTDRKKRYEDLKTTQPSKCRNK